MSKSSGKQKVYIVIAAVLAVSILVFALVFRNINDSRSYGKYMDAANEAIMHRDYESALSALRKAATIDDTDESLLLMASCYENLGNYDMALQTLRLLDTTNPTYASRIAAVENKKMAEEEAELVTVGGEKHKTNEVNLALDNKGLGNSVLSEVTQLYALSNLSLAGNNISDITPLVSLGGLTTLNLSNNQISDISALANLNSLRTLYLDNNPVGDLSPLYSIPTLSTLSIQGITISVDELEALSKALPNCAINGATATEKPSVIALGGVSFDPSVTEIDLSYCGITDISALSQCQNLGRVVLRGNSIMDISPLMDIPNLTYLDISENAVSDLRPLMGITSLRYLYVSSNYVSTTVPLGAITGLTELDISNNPISNFGGLKKLKNLVNLNIANTGFSEADIQNFTLLSRLLNLDITGNDQISGEEFSELQQIIPTCEIAHSDLVFTIFVENYPVQSDATDINLSGTGISDISALTQLLNLQSISLSNNNISNLYPFSVTEGWRSITYLDLSSNNIDDTTALQHLSNLTELNLSDNNISNITPLRSLENLQTLYIGGNPISDEDLTTLEVSLPNCNIIAR